MFLYPDLLFSFISINILFLAYDYEFLVLCWVFYDLLVMKIHD